MNFEVVYSKRKTLALQVTRDGKLIVRAPFGTGEKKIRRMIDDHRLWIEKTLERQKNAPVMTDDREKLAALTAKAKAVLPEKVAKYSALMKLCPAAVCYGHAKTRFGCCTSEKKIIFSVYLMLYPDAAIDYVVVHELAHLKYMDHSARFYRLVGSVLPDYKERIRLLKP